MAKVKVGIKGFSREQIADKIDTVKTAMTGNANFPWLFNYVSMPPRFTARGAVGKLIYPRCCEE